MTRLLYQRRLAAGHYFIRLTESRNRSWTVAAAGASLDQVDGRLPTRLDRDEALVDGLRQHEPGAAEHLVITYGDRAYRLAITDHGEWAAHRARLLLRQRLGEFMPRRTI